VFKSFLEINSNGYIIVGWIDSLIKTNSKPLLVRSNPDPNKPWILDENKVLFKPKQALGCS
jgi:hypothetical protein